MDPKGFGRKDNSASLMAMGVTRPGLISRRDIVPIGPSLMSIEYDTTRRSSIKPDPQVGRGPGIIRP